MSAVSGRKARGVGYDTFADLVADGVHVTNIATGADGLTVVTFDADLDAPTAQSVRDRMTSRDDDDQAARANLACLRDAITGTDPTSLALVAAINYMLGV